MMFRGSSAITSTRSHLCLAPLLSRRLVPRAVLDARAAGSPGRLDFGILQGRPTVLRMMARLFNQS